MILGVGTDICPVARWERLLARHGEKALQRVLADSERDELGHGNPKRLAERVAGRWALREAFGKALGTGLDGWSWRDLRYREGRLWAEEGLSDLLASRRISRLHGSVSHDGGMAFAVVILEADSI